MARSILTYVWRIPAEVEAGPLLPHIEPSSEPSSCLPTPRIPSFPPVYGNAEIDKSPLEAGSSAKPPLWAAAKMHINRNAVLLSEMLSVIVFLSIIISLSVVYGHPRPANAPGSSPASSWSLDNFKSLVTFGDSYTDESRGNYFVSHGGSPPPVGWVEPVVSAQRLTRYYPFK
jgi:hypothetical protein